MFVTIFASCEKEEVIEPIEVVAPINTQVIMSQLALVPILTLETVQDSISAKNTQLKDGSVTKPIIRLFELDFRTSKIEGAYAYKYLAYYVLLNQNLREIITIIQKFPIKDGKIDTSIYMLDFKKFGILDRNFFFNEDDRNYINQVYCHLRSNDGVAFGFYINSYDAINLAPIANAKWQLEVTYYNGQINPTYMSNLLNYDSPSELKMIVKVEKENINSVFRIQSSMMNDVDYIQLFGDNDQFISYRFKAYESMPAWLSFPANFDVRKVLICSIFQGCNNYEVKLSSGSPINGPKIFELK